jgi:hypothetical protein
MQQKTALPDCCVRRISSTRQACQALWKFKALYHRLMSLTHQAMVKPVRRLSLFKA